MRELLSIAGHPPLMVTPLSGSSWLLTDQQCEAMRAVLAGQGWIQSSPDPTRRGRSASRQMT